MAALSDHLFLVTIVLYAIAMVGYAFDLAFRRAEKPVIRAAAPSAPASERVLEQRVMVGAGAPRGAGAGSALPSAPRPPSVGSGVGAPPAPESFGRMARAAVALTVLGYAAHLGTILTRGLAAHRVPWGNMYEFSTVMAFVAVTAFLVMLVKYRTRWLGVFVLLPVVLYLGFAGTVLYAKAGPLVPALNSYWLKIHVLAAISASGMFFVSGIIAALFLAKDRWPDGSVMRKLPPAERLDRLSYQLIALSFPIWTFAIIAGAIWAEAAWSRYWGWDPKETWSFITWVIYAAYLHSRVTVGWRGRRAAWFALAACLALFIDYFVVNIFIVGLHSYAGVS